MAPANIQLEQFLRQNQMMLQRGGGSNVDSPNLQDAQYPQCTYLESNIEQSPAAPTMMDTPRPSETPRRPTEKLPRDSRDFPPPAVPAGSDKDALYWKLLSCN